MSVTNGPRRGLMINALTGDGFDASFRVLLRALDALLFCSVINRTTSAPPGSPANGDAYVVQATGSGAWTGHDKAIAIWTTDNPAASSGEWEFYAAANGMLVYSVADAALYLYNGSTWISSAGAPLNSPAFTGVPTAPTAAPGTNTTQISTTAFVAAAIAALIASAPGTLDTLNELATALADDPNFATTITTALALKAPLASPALTGSPTAPTASPLDASTKVATTAYTDAACAAVATSGGIVSSVAGRTGAVVLAESDITSLATDLAATEKTANKGVASGYASLDSGGHVPLAQIPASVAGALEYQGTWDATANSPTLASGVGTKGFFYKVATAGATTLDGYSAWHVGDLLIFDGTVWDKVDNYEAVTSVAGRTGAITIAESDVASLTTDLAAKAPLASPALTGNPTAPTQTALDASTKIATTAYTDAAVAASAPTAIAGVNTQTASYTVVLGDAGKLVRMNVATANNLTIPPHSSVAFAVNTVITVRQIGAGITTIVAGAGVTIASPATLAIARQKGSVQLVQVATDTWDLMGDVT